MLDVEHKDRMAVIDVRERIIRGEHPRAEIIQFVKEAETGTIIEIHLPHRAQPLLVGLQSLGVNVTIDELESDHFCMRCIKF